MQRIGIAICTPWPFTKGATGKPVHEPMSPLWHRKRYALSMPTNTNVTEWFADGMAVDAARNSVARRIAEDANAPEFLFFLDYDVLPPFDAVTKLVYRARHFPDCDVFAGVYTPKWLSPPEPIIYAGDGLGPYWDWTIGDLLTTQRDGITGTHCGCTLIRSSLLKRLLPFDEADPWFVTTNDQAIRDGVLINRRGTEDLYFYNRTRRVLGECNILVDTSVLCMHLDKNTGIQYGLPVDSGPAKRARWLPQVKETMDGDAAAMGESPDAAEKKALDLGAGSMRREWPGHRTYTTDLRPDVEPDYVMDTRKLNLPDDHFELVASSHHLEHLPRWDQEQAWSEIFRVCKPGGRIEIIVPSMEWAAHKVIDGQEDDHTYNVLYGAQEAHGYARNLNTHYFGYTKQVGRSLAMQAGFVDVVARDWRDNEQLGYNLIITGCKPEEISSDKVWNERSSNGDDSLSVRRAAIGAEQD